MSFQALSLGEPGHGYARKEACQYVFTIQFDGAAVEGPDFPLALPPPGSNRLR